MTWVPAELLVWCPECGADTGQACLNRSGSPYRKGTHTARQEQLQIQKMIAGARHRIAWRRRPEGQQLLEAAVACGICDQPLKAPVEIDHIVPFGLGGLDHPRNLRVVCRNCNQRRRRDGSDLNQPLHHLLADGLLELLWDPRRPPGDAR